ncbi:MAG TPA: hypothetical protein DD381_12765 [Lentisphaeria bacterium]|nr:MAG: hypothetical protein A2X47_12335 [Lentisphaerae bacterium GWF2_38_69]HBM17196.1 hypothetical protein [Lentisphaeria bacterium]
MIFLYNLIFPIVLLFYLPGNIYKYLKRGGVKKNYLERFAIFSEDKKRELDNIKGRRIWIHAVSVGETQLAIDFIKALAKSDTAYNFIISTTTTTGQELAVNKLKNLAAVIFCPLDYFLFVRKTINLINPEILIIIETELWPSMIYEAHRKAIRIAQVNARISDRSFKMYKIFSCFVKPFVSLINVSCAQTQTDAQRLNLICPSLNIVETGNMKFDQSLPEEISDICLEEFFGKGSFIYIIGASTHPGEEKLIIGIYKKLLNDFNNLRLILVPRHAERAKDILKELKKAQIPYLRKSNNSKWGTDTILCLLADTTGEMHALMQLSDIVIMCKSFAGNAGGHNIIEPALLGKAIITGRELSNFRFVMKIMLDKNAILGVTDNEIEDAIRKLIENPAERTKLGETAKSIVLQNTGAINRTVKEIEKLIKKHVSNK